MNIVYCLIIVCFLGLGCVQSIQCSVMRTLPESAESKRPDKYSPLLYMVRIELTSAGCALCLPQEKTQFPYQNGPGRALIKKKQQK